MRKNIIPILITIVITACATSSEFIRPGINFSKYKRIAILPLSDYYSAPGSGVQVADIISMKMLSTPLQIIDRSQTQKILEEQAIGLSGIIDSKTATEVGKILGVQVFLTGSINKWSSTNVNIQVVQGAPPAYMDFARAGITLKLIDAETGEIVWAGSAEGSYTGPNQESTAAAEAIDHLLEKFKSHFY